MTTPLASNPPHNYRLTNESIAMPFFTSALPSRATPASSSRTTSAAAAATAAVTVAAASPWGRITGFGAAGGNRRDDDARLPPRDEVLEPCELVGAASLVDLDLDGLAAVLEGHLSYQTPPRRGKEAYAMEWMDGDVSIC